MRRNGLSLNEKLTTSAYFPQGSEGTPEPFSSILRHPAETQK